MDNLTLKYLPCIINNKYKFNDYFLPKFSFYLNKYNILLLIDMKGCLFLYNVFFGIIFF